MIHCRRTLGLGLLVTLLVGGCATRAQLPTSAAVQGAGVTEPAQASALPPTGTAVPPTITVTTHPTATATATQPPSTPTAAFALCSPLEGILIADLGKPDLLKTPFQAPRPGLDDGHHGVDFSYWSRGERKAMLGHPVQSVLSGQVAGVILNKQPYGNAVIIETPLQAIPQSLLQAVSVPTPAPTVPPAPALTCPVDPTNYTAQGGRSLYLLYAHFDKPPMVSVGSQVTCGQQIGVVGTTGNSVNPHLHLETRVGPSGARFASMDYYNAGASEAERATYCTWRISGLFQLFDPMKLFNAAP